MTTATVTRTRKLTGVAILSAVSVVLSFLSFPVPLMPSFIKLDFAELPALIASFAYGPISGIAVCLVKNLIALIKTSSGGIGTLWYYLGGGILLLTGTLALFGSGKRRRRKRRT